MNGFAPRVIFRVPYLGMAITETVTTTWMIMAALIIFSVVTTRNLKRIPGPLQNVAEMMVYYTRWLVDNTMGVGFEGLVPYMGTLSIFLLLANMIGVLPGFRPPSSDLNTPFALALLSFMLIHYHGIKKKGLYGYLRSFFAPIPFLFPLNVLGELAFPLSLAFRLFGNMIGAVVILALVYGFLPPIVPIIPHLYFDLFAGLIQAFIFTMLTMTYLALAVD